MANKGIFTNTLKVLILLIGTTLFSAISAQETAPEVAQFVNLLEQGKFKKAYNQFDDTLSEKLSKDRLALIFNDIKDKYGALEKTEAVKEIRLKNGYLYHTKLYYEKEFAIVLQLSFSEDKKEIRGLFLSPTKYKNTYKQPLKYGTSGYGERNLAVPTPYGDLPAKLILPEWKNNCPVVIIVHGSGPVDMDGSLGAIKTYYDIALGLADSGIATLIYDKRTNAIPISFSDTSTLYSETIQDVGSAIELLKGQARIDSNSIFVAGHSLGGMSTPRIMRLNKDLKGGIMLAAPYRQLHEIIPLQYEYYLNKKVTGYTKEIVDKAKIAAKEVEDGKIVGTQKDKLMGLSGYYWEYLQKYSPSDELLEIDRPMLMIFGERDCQVNMDEYNLWEQKVKGKENITVKSFPGLNHNLIFGTRPSLPSEYDKPDNVSHKVILTMIKWIRKNR